MRYSSTALAAKRPSAIAHTTSDWPRRMSPAAKIPETMPDGTPLKPLSRVILDRRATSHFKPDPVPQEYLNAILQLASQAPSGYDLQPWRFIVVKDEQNRRRLQKAAMNQAKVGEAPVVIIAIGDDY